MSARSRSESTTLFVIIQAESKSGRVSPGLASFEKMSPWINCCIPVMNSKGRLLRKWTTSDFVPGHHHFDLIWSE